MKKKNFIITISALAIFAMLAIVAVPTKTWAQSMGQIPIIGQIVSASGNPILSPNVIHAPPGSSHDNLEEYLDDAGTEGAQGAFNQELLTCSENAPSQPTGGQYITETHVLMNAPQGWLLPSNTIPCVDPDVVWAVNAWVDPGTCVSCHLNWGAPFQLGALDLTDIQARIRTNATGITTLTGVTETLQTEIEAERTRINSVEHLNTAQTASISQNVTDIGTNRTNITANASAISTANINIGHNEDGVEAARGETSTNLASINGLQEDVAEIEADGWVTMSRLSRTIQAAIANAGGGSVDLSAYRTATAQDTVTGNAITTALEPYRTAASQDLVIIPQIAEQYSLSLIHI